MSRLVKKFAGRFNLTPGQLQNGYAVSTKIGSRKTRYGGPIRRCLHVVVCVWLCLHEFACVCVCLRVFLCMYVCMYVFLRVFACVRI